MATAIKCAAYALVFVFALISTAFFASATDENRKVYIVYMGDKPNGQILTQEFHTNLLDGVLEGSSSRESLVYSYTRSLNGFAAKLTEKEANKIADLEGVVSIFPNKEFTYHTTRSWDFLHLPLNVTRNPTIESDIIVGVIDTGIIPESKSFADNGLGPPPAKWKGVFQKIKCNNKLIGARVYPSTDPDSSPIDENGHGTHTASIVAGQSVDSASLFGIAEGTARGAVPSARIAAYKVCTSYRSCLASDLLAAFDDAIADGVDILSVSMGGWPSEYFEDPIAIGSFHAMKNGVLTSVSAGNSGPDRESVLNVAPWMIVVAASSIDRHIIDKLVLGDGTTIVGASVNAFPTENKSTPIYYLGDKSELFDCNGGDTSVEGKIVVCSSLSHYSYAITHYDAKGVVFVGDDGLDVSYVLAYPAMGVNSSLGKDIFSYISKTKKPVAHLHKSEAIYDSNAPIVASFSSRGPNFLTRNILKPDISAPGIDILAAWSENQTISDLTSDPRRSKFNIVSGTSMSCPHVSGAAAYVKSFNPKWSPAMIMSALITSATPMDPRKHGGDAELSYGAGQINPVNAVDPGLVYDATVVDYIHMLCDQGYDESQIRLVTGDNGTTCTKGEKGDAKDLNYPSLALRVNSGERFKEVTFKRTATNVGDAMSNYTAKISSVSGLKVTVDPQTLTFSKVDQKQTFVVTVSGGPLKATSVASASIVWSDGKHNVRSPLVVYTTTSK